MTIQYTLLAFSILLLSSCTMSTPNPTETGSVVQVDDTDTIDSTEYQQPLVEDLSGSGGAYYPVFDGLETKEIRVMHETGVATRIFFINSEAKAIEVSIEFPEASGANLRWSQIIMPDGTMDGPFGQHVGYNLTQLGGYELIFNENMMAGEPWSGEADITLKLLDEPYNTQAVLLD